MKTVVGPEMSRVSRNYHEDKGVVVMEMASIDVKIRHVFEATCFRPAAPPVIGSLLAARSNWKAQ